MGVTERDPRTDCRKNFFEGRCTSELGKVSVIREAMGDEWLSNAVPNGKGASMSTASFVDARETVRYLTPTLRAGAADVDERRAISPELSNTLIDAGVFRLLAPRSIGGDEIDPVAFFDVVEQASYADGSVGWLVRFGGCYVTFGGMLPTAAAHEIYGDHRAVTAGAFRLNGTAVEVENGYRVTGRWPQGGGSCDATWFLGGTVILADGQPVIGPTGMPMMREFWFRAEETEVIDTWTTTGLRGTASHDYAVKDVFVPAEHSCCFMEPPVEAGPLYQMPPIAMFAAFISACRGVSPDTRWTSSCCCRRARCLSFRDRSSPIGPLRTPNSAERKRSSSRATPTSVVC